MLLFFISRPFPGHIEQNVPKRTEASSHSLTIPDTMSFFGRPIQQPYGDRAMVNSGVQKPPLRTQGLVLHSAARYDLLVRLFTLGRERAFRDKMLRLARLQPGEIVLDVGCGTGTLAILAGRQVEPTGTVYGIDASSERIARAAGKAQRQGSEVIFKVGAAQALPFADAQLDVVLTTLMLHHLPRSSRQRFASEVRRVLKPGGRMLAIDFGKRSHGRERFLSGLHRRHGRTRLEDNVTLLSEAGLTIVNCVGVGTKNLHFVSAIVPSGPTPAVEVAEVKSDRREQSTNLRPHHFGGDVGKRVRRHLLPVVIVLAVILAALMHLGVAASVFAGGVILSPMTTLGLLGLAGLVLLKVVVKAGLIFGRYRKRRSDP